ncbi:MAG: pseudouridine synthase [Rhodocyclaceae bacterium]|nr:pseudouridine synthase [Rhodocyclaceae bacterium]
MSLIAWDKLLHSQGFGTRKQCQGLLASGVVSVGGEVVDNYCQTVEPQGLVFEVAGTVWEYRRHVYLALNKPANIECSRKPSHHPGVLSLLPDQFRARDVQPVGRLDHDTTGLLLLSDDGAFIHAQSSPKRQVPKVYVAVTHEPVTEALVAMLSMGVKLHDEPFPLRATHCRAIAEFELEIVVEQGKYHQVKRMLAAAGNHCVALRRVAIGDLSLQALGLDNGQWRHLGEQELVLLNYPPASATSATASGSA